MSTDLGQFLRARLDEDEQTAKAALPGPWLVGTEHDRLLDWVVYGQSRWVGHLGQVCNVEYGHDGAENAVHIARHSPARVHAEVAAKRRIVDDAVRLLSPDPLRSGDYWRGARDAAEGYLRLLALLFSDHPDYDESWRP